MLRRQSVYAGSQSAVAYSAIHAQLARQLCVRCNGGRRKHVRLHKPVPWFSSRVSACRRGLNSHQSFAARQCPSLCRTTGVASSLRELSSRDPLLSCRSAGLYVALGSEPRSNSQSSVSLSGHRHPTKSASACQRPMRRHQEPACRLLLRGAGHVSASQRASKCRHLAQRVPGEPAE